VTEPPPPPPSAPPWEDPRRALKRAGLFPLRGALDLQHADHPRYFARGAVIDAGHFRPVNRGPGHYRVEHVVEAHVGAVDGASGDDGFAVNGRRAYHVRVVNLSGGTGLTPDITPFVARLETHGVSRRLRQLTVTCGEVAVAQVADRQLAGGAGQLAEA
jgi:hypothetical protein